MAVPRRWMSLLLVAAAAVALAGCEKTTRDTDIKLISVGEAKALWDRAQKGQPDLVLFIDPRPLKYYSAGHIPGAEHIELPRFDPRDRSLNRDPRLDRYSNLVVYGDDPANAVSKGMTKRLLEFDYKGVRWFAGGIKEWTARGYATEPPVPPSEPAPATAAPPPSGSAPEPSK